MSSAQAGQAGLAGRKTSLTDEKSRLASQRPQLAADFAAKKSDYDAKLKEVDAKRVEALAEDKGVEGTGKVGRGPMYRQRMGELALLQSAAQIAQERMKDAQKRLTTVESRLTAIDTELANVDGDLAKYKGEADTAEQRIKLTENTDERWWRPGGRSLADPADLRAPQIGVPLRSDGRTPFQRAANVQRHLRRAFSNA